MNKTIIGLVFLASMVLSGCTSCGPFITSISSDGGNRLHIEKCMVYMNAFMGTVSNSECTSQDITVTSALSNRRRTNSPPLEYEDSPSQDEEFEPVKQPEKSHSNSPKKTKKYDPLPQY